MCGTELERLYVHHKDGRGKQDEKPNHDISNLLVVCAKCHFEQHGIRDVAKMNNIKILRESMTFQEIASIYGVSRQRIHQIYSSI